MKPKRLPNNFGHISKLSGTRRKPYMARTSSREVIGYSETYEGAFALLIEYNKDPYDIDLKKATVEDIWEIFKETEMENYSKGTQQNFIKRYNKYVKRIKDREYASLKTFHFMKFLKSCECTDNMFNQVIVLLKHLDDVAYRLDIIDKKYAHEIRGKSFKQKEERIPFTEEEIKVLWDNVDKPFVDYILISIYTGFRANELIKMTVEDIDLENWTMTGGSKTKAGKNRVVPIHDRIKPLVENIVENSQTNLFYDRKYDSFKRHFKSVTKNLLGTEHIPHEARHTMRTRLDDVGANKVAIDRILGHKSGDTGMDVYTHKSIDQLREAIALLK